MSVGAEAGPSGKRRRERRVPVHLPLLIRGTDRGGEPFEEETSSENLCRSGAAFATRYTLDLGTQIEIKIPVVPAAVGGSKEFSTSGRIVHVGPWKTEAQRIVGVVFTGPRFHRMFVSESTE